ncbi:hypothetical protein P175DRAFT_0497605 [Aspergillus ochraceoroseus IBT 24754]|uniref:Spondin domain-containing protein n=1 Tax=Aspergillus ochraceoroseus IBT 24754 TaxID=1392256 RepID=A0A2T5M7H0_9EURO|nr:uncharacterized protein P175DRAFT_0497605 [Aspergillus ochraceoroseus IBT 24754]PTU24474.1 hypothetical protein P175DRAFT_0497605 [Aspergillus ochraceoroseus IBT 24754]
MDNGLSSRASNPAAYPEFEIDQIQTKVPQHPSQPPRKEDLAIPCPTHQTPRNEEIKIPVHQDGTMS